MSGAVELSVAVVVEAMGDGRVRAAPLFERAWMTHDDEEDALEALRSFLEARLAEASPAAVARLASCALPDHHAIRMVAVEAQVSDHDEEPLRFDVACVVLGPHASTLARRALPPVDAARPAEPDRTPMPPFWDATKDLWVAVPVIDHVLRVPAEVADLGELDAAIAREVRRILAATARSALDVVAALPPASTRIERLECQVRRPERLDAETRARGQRASSEALRIQEKQRHLASMGRRVEAAPRPARRDELISSLGALLDSSERLAVLVRGPELAGKTSLIEHVLGRGGSRLAFAIPVARFLAGDGAFGEWQTRVEETFRAAELLDAVIYVEDLGSLALERPGSPIDLAAAISPFLEARKVRFVGEIRDAELDRFESRHRGLSSALVPLRVPALDATETVRVLEERLGVEAVLPPPPATATPRRRIDGDAIRSLVTLVSRYLPYRALPGEALRTAEALRDALEVPRGPDGTVPPIGRPELIRALAERLGLPAALLREDVALAPAEIAEALRARVIGQEEAIDAVAATLGVVKAGLAPTGKPIATFLFAGPTGTGKTELARALAAFLFGSAEALARFDMSEFMDPWSTDRLIRGTDREDGLLTRRARERPFSVLLLDEIEKAHPSVFDLLLQLLGEGRLTDARGKTAFFQNTIVVMTSNLGARSDRPPLGFAADARDRGEVYLRAVREHFRPELLNRIDRIVPFRPLRTDEALRIARLFAHGLTTRPGIVDGRHDLALRDDALGAITEQAVTADGGARALRREIEDRAVVAAARSLARLGPGVERAGIEISVAPPDARTVGTTVSHAGLVSVVRRSDPTRPKARSALDRITALRRRLSRWSRLSSVEASRAEVARLVSELARAARRKATAPEIGALEQRHGWYAPRVARVDGLLAELEATEDLALAAHVAEEDASPLADEAARLARALELAIFDVVGSWSSSDEHEIVVTAISGGTQGLAAFVLPLLTPPDALHVHLECHFPAGVGAPSPEWPAERAWGPMRSPPEAREILAAKGRVEHVQALASGRDSYLAFSHFLGLFRFRRGSERLDVLLGEPELGPYSSDARLPELTAVPTTPVVEIDLDAGQARLVGDEESHPFPNRDWPHALPQLVLSATAREEGL